MSLANALPKAGGTWKRTELHLPTGEHKGYFIGLSDPIEEESNFPCKACKGQGVQFDSSCRACNGTGRKVSQKVAIRYQMGPTLIEEEWVTYVLTGPKTGKDGNPQAPSTLWKRLKALSGQTEPAEIVKWFDNLPKPIKVPMKMMIIDGDRGREEIAFIAPFQSRSAAQPQPAPEPQEPEWVSDNFGDQNAEGDAVPF